MTTDHGKTKIANNEDEGNISKLVRSWDSLSSKWSMWGEKWVNSEEVNIGKNSGENLSEHK